MDSALRKQLKDIAWCKEVWKEPVCTGAARDLVRECASLPTSEPEPEADLLQVIDSSRRFPIPFPIDTVRLEKLKRKHPAERLIRNISSTYPIIHERVVLLIANFLVYKRKYGSKIEKELYKNMTIAEFIDRILKKRAVTFIKAQDQYKLLSGHKGVDGWESVGTDEEKPPLLLRDCLSYDEMKIAALVSVSGRTVCINDGTRKNAGVVREDNVESEAIIIGVIGPRFKRTNRMEYEDMLVTEDQNIPENGYGTDAPDAAKRAWRQLWEDFYQIPSTTHSALTARVKLVPCSGKRVFGERWARVKTFAFDNLAYHRRTRLLADLVLAEANARAKEEGKSAFLNVIGAGLGLWKVSGHQLDVYILTFLERIVALLDEGQLDNVADVNFAYIKPGKEVAAFFKECKENPDCKKLFIKNESHPRGGLNVQLENREPSTRLSGAHEGKLLVLTYAWDSNAHPGNEFWIGKLSSSGDSAAACATQITELHNAHINPAVCGERARVAAARVQTLQQYAATLQTI
ncbi:uncharacterized protein LOC114355289 isoform X2 [Ostrinia furnacalis]|uniref:uncharacterized protein LOC114355289 isoform X2 n=1 Tax=Ostrinia furnacalis TaxID=93504 RepID=UPI00103BF632|nr:uncharacterized protein LOC114355289 isoform X2 [Ostrinia furnacalis]